MKASLKAKISSPNWIDKLHWILLGIRSAPKDDLHASSAELVYGELLTVTGSFVTTNTVPWFPLDPLNIPKSVPTSPHGNTKTHVPDDLLSAKNVFIRLDSHQTPLQRAYDGPYEVIATGHKTFRIRVGGKESVISIDRIKPAHIDHTTHVTVDVSPRRGRPPPNPPKNINVLANTTWPIISRHMIREIYS